MQQNWETKVVRRKWLDPYQVYSKTASMHCKQMHHQKILMLFVMS